MEFSKDELYHLIRGVETDKAKRWDKTTDRRLTKLLIKLKKEMITKNLLGFAALLLLSSCGMMNKLSDEQVLQKSKLNYEMNKLYNEYQVKNDSLLVEYYKIK